MLQSSRILKRVLNYMIYIIMLFNIVTVVIKNDITLFLIVSIYIISFWIVTNIISRNTTLIFFIVLLYFAVVGPIEMLLAEFVPHDIFGFAYYRYIDLVENKELYWEYLWRSLLLLVLINCFYILFKSIKFPAIHFSQLSIKYRKSSKLVNYITMMLYAILTYFLRITFRLELAGERATIPFSGIIIYLYTAIGVLFVFYQIKSIMENRNMDSWSFLEIIICVGIVYSPSIFLNRRAPFFYMLATCLLYCYEMNPYLFIGFIKKHKKIVIAFLIGVLVLFQVVTFYFRYHGTVNVSILYIFSRLTGLAPGLIFLNNSLESLPALTFVDYLKNTFGDRSTSINKIFTRNVLHYPDSAIHGSSIPLFIGCSLYGKIFGYLFFSLLFSLVLAMIDKLLKMKNDVQSEKYRFIGCYLLIYSINMLMEGTAESLIALFTVPVLICIFPNWISQKHA